MPNYTLQPAAFPDQYPELHAQGLHLRALGSADVPAWFQRMQDDESLHLAGDPRAESLAQISTWVRAHELAFAEGSGIRWGIVPQGSDHAVGSVGLMDIDLDARRADMGGVIGRANWNQGLMTAAGQLVRDYAFNQMQLQRLQADLLRANHASKAVLQKLGFQEEAVLRNYRAVDGQMVEGLLYACTPAPPPGLAKVRAQYHSRQTETDLLIWNVRRLIELSATLPRQRVEVDTILKQHENHWYGDNTLRATPSSVLEHAGLIREADLRYPIILDPNGRVMDGMHRVCRAKLEGRRWINAVQFTQDPTPDYKNVPNDALPYDD